METYICYHGTSRDSSIKILKEQRINPSTKPDEWAGCGAYFFADWNNSGTKAAQNAFKWALKSNRKYTPTVIRAEIEAEKDWIFDLTDPENQETFHKFRECYFRAASKRVEKGIITESDTKNSGGVLDCTIINTICDEAGFRAVVKQCYINFNPYMVSGTKYPNSHIPNCTIFCLRDLQLIKHLEAYENGT